MKGDEALQNFSPQRLREFGLRHLNEMLPDPPTYEEIEGHVNSNQNQQTTYNTASSPQIPTRRNIRSDSEIDTPQQRNEITPPRQLTTHNSQTTLNISPPPQSCGIPLRMTSRQNNPRTETFPGNGGRERDTDTDCRYEGKESVRQLRIPADLAGWIYGSKGNTAKTIQANTGAKLDFNEDVDNVQNTIISIRGGSSSESEAGEMYIFKMIKKAKQLVCLETSPITAEIEELFNKWTETEMLEFYKTTRCVFEVGNLKLVLKGFFEEDKTAANQRLSQIVEYEQMHSRRSSDDRNIPGLGEGAPVAVPRNQTSNETVSLNIPSSQGGLIIGKGGRTLRSLKEQSGAEIKVMQNGEETTIEIAGSLECVAAACGAVITQIKSSQILKERVLRNCSAEVLRMVEAWTVYIIVKFYLESGAFVEVAGDTLVVKGFTEESIIQAEMRLQNEFCQNQNQVNQRSVPDNQGISTEMRMPRSQGGLICGKLGVILRQIMQETGATLSFNQHGSESETSILQINGPPACVPNAEIAVLNRLEKSNILKTKLAPAAHSIVRDWQQTQIVQFYKDAGCILQIDNNTLILKYFYEDNLILAEKKLNQMIKDRLPKRAPTRVFEMNVLRSLVGLIIGKEGVMVKHIEDSTQTKISTQREVLGNPEKTKVKIEGSEEGIADAKAAIDQLLSRAEQQKTCDDTLIELNCNDIVPVVNPMLESWEQATLMTFQRKYSTTICMDFTSLILKGLAMEDLTAARSKLIEKAREHRTKRTLHNGHVYTSGPN